MRELALRIPGYGEIKSPDGVPSNTGQNTLFGGFNNAFIMVFVIAVIIALFFLIWGGVQWIMSQGDKSKVQAARMRITYAIAGLLLLFFSIFIINLMGYFFNVNLLG